MRRMVLNSLRPLQDIMLETNAMYRWVNAHPLLQFASDYHMYVDVGLDATANSEITFHLMVN